MLIDSLEAPDAMLRTKIIEALGYLRTRRLDLKFHRRKMACRTNVHIGALSLSRRCLISAVTMP